MKKLMIAAASAAAIGFSAVAADWFNGGFTENWPTNDGMNGAWSNVGTMSYVKGTGVEVTAAKETPLTFTAKDAKALADIESATITSTVTFSPFPADEKPEIPADAKAGVIVVKDGDVLSYYVIARPNDGDTTNGWVQAESGPAPVTDSAVDVTIIVTSADELVTYYVGDTTGNAIYEGYGIMGEEPTVSTVCYAGDGTVASLTGTYEGGEPTNPWPGKGTEDEPFEVSDYAGLIALQQVTNGNQYAGCFFKQTAIIDLGGEVWPGIGAFNAKDVIADKDTYVSGAFQGNFDGDGCTIEGLVLARGDYVGFFGSTYKATIKNLNISLGNETGFATEGRADYGGGVIAGVTVDSVIENCATEIDGDYDTFQASKGLAGIVGYSGAGTTIKDCVNNLNIVTANEKAAGIAACVQDGAAYTEVKGTVIDGCENYGNITCTTANKEMSSGIAGLIGAKTTFKGDIVFEGTVTCSGNKVQSLGFVSGGSIVIDDDATFTVPAAIKSVNAAVDGLFFATVNGDVATLVKNAAVVKGGNYKVMAAGAPAITLEAIGDSITIDTSLATVNVTTTATDAKVVQDGNVYTVVLAGAAKIGTTYYLTLNDALEAAQDGDTVTLCTSITTAETAAIKINKSITLDFATFTVTKTVANDYTFDIPKDVTVVFKGTTGGVTQTASNLNPDWPASMIRNKGNLTIEGGVYTSDFCIIKNDEDPGAGVLTVNGGTFNMVETEYGYTGFQASLMNWATATINGGEWNGGAINTRSSDNNAASKSGTTVITKTLDGTATYVLTVGYDGDTTYANVPKIKGVALADVELKKVATITDELELVQDGDYVTVQKKVTGPYTPGVGGGTVEPVPGEENVYEVQADPSSKTVTIQGGLTETDTIRVTTAEDITVVGVPASQIEVKINGKVIPNGAFVGGDDTGFSTALNPEATVKVGEEEIPVKPTAIEAAASEGTIADGAVATKAIPGLTYKLMRGTELGTYETEAATAVATETTVSLKDANKPADKAFYVIEVTK